MAQEKKVRGTKGSKPKTPVTNEFSEMAKRISEARERLEMTQREFGELIGVSQGQVSKLENPTKASGIRLISAYRVAKKLDMTLDQLVLGHPNFLALAMAEAARQGLTIPIVPAPSAPESAPEQAPDAQPAPTPPKQRRKPRG